MLIELNSKAGALCQHAVDGKIRCPLMVRASSEDVVTDHLFGTLNLIQPRWWLPVMLNRGLCLPQGDRLPFRTQIYRGLTIRLWEKQSKYPAELLPWLEGITEVDAVIEWENPPTTIFIEMKYGSPLSKVTSRNSGEFGYPADQLIRNIRIGLRRTGWFRQEELLRREKRDFLILVISPDRDRNPLVDNYQQAKHIKASIPLGDRIHRLPLQPFVGYMSYGELLEVLLRSSAFMSRAERVAVQRLNDYLTYKIVHTPNRTLGKDSSNNRPIDLFPGPDAGSEDSNILSLPRRPDHQEQEATTSP